jgi:hypothetical protein
MYFKKCIPLHLGIGLIYYWHAFLIPIALPVVPFPGPITLAGIFRAYSARRKNITIISNPKRCRREINKPRL